jgi:sugar/nucleoside kinase (ribokinase family)
VATVKYDVLGIGNPMLDILTRVDEGFIGELGFTKGMFNLVSQKQSKEIFSKITRFGVDVEAGDATANCLAVVCNFGGVSALIGKLGDDENGRIYLEKTKKGGMLSLMCKNPDVPTGTVISLITPDSQRTFATFLGASLTLEPQDLPMEELIQGRVLHLTGYQLDDPGLREVALRAMKAAKVHGLKVSIDVADMGVVERNLPLLQEVIANTADVIFLNEDEGQKFTGLTDDEEIIRALMPICKTVCYKIGSKGSMIGRDGVIHRIAPVKVKAVDSTGAGDSYAGGVLYGLLKGLPIEVAGQMGSIVASHVVSIMGARASCKLMDLLPEEIQKQLDMNNTVFNG